MKSSRGAGRVGLIGKEFLVSKLTVSTRHDASEGHSLTTVMIKGLGRFEVAEITFEVSGADRPQLTPNGNFAIAAVLPIAMSRASAIHYEGEVDSAFLTSIEECMSAWCRLRPDLFRPVTLSADVELPPHLPACQEGLLAFSGGLDSVFALHAHKNRLVGRRSVNVTAAVLVHGFDIPPNASDAFAIARRHSMAILDSYGVRLNTVRTNWKDFAIKWEMTHVFGLAATLHLFHRKFGVGIFADDFSYDAQWMPWSNNMTTNQMLGSTAFAIRSTGASWSRTEKAAIVAENSTVLRHLRVCYEHPELGENCGHCEKCIRTKVNFYAAGARSLTVLGPAITLDDVRALPELNAESVLWYSDAEAKGSWAPADPIRREIKRRVDAFYELAGKPQSALRARERSVLYRVRKKVKRTFRPLKLIFQNRQS